MKPYHFIFQMCNENGGAVPFGEDDYYEQIVVQDFRGYDFQKQRESWREGTDFTFKAQFFAEAEESSVEEQEELELDDMLNGVVDTTADDVVVDAKAEA